MYHHIRASGDNSLLRTLLKLMEETVGLGYLEWFFILGQEKDGDRGLFSFRFLHVNLDPTSVFFAGDSGFSVEGW